MYMWIFGAALLLYVVRFLWKAYTHPSHVLGRQAANMNWIAIGTLRDKDGFKNLNVTREGMEAIISYKNGNVILKNPNHPEPFKDFIEVERWIATNTLPMQQNDEIEYYEKIEDFITLKGFYEKLLELEGTDKEYCIAAMKVRKAGYLSGQPEKVVGALIMDSASNYNRNREYALGYLESLEKQFLDEVQVRH